VSRRTSIALGILVVAAIALGGYLVWRNADQVAPDPAVTTDSPDATNDITADETSTPDEPAETPAEEKVPDATSVDDPVPADVVRLLFDKLENAGYAVQMNQTYKVEFGESTDRVRISGAFVQGPKEFEFEYDDGEWRLEDTDDE